NLTSGAMAFPSPAPSGDFKIRWEGAIYIPASGKTTFYLETSDSASLTIDDRSPNSSGEIALWQGWHLFQLDYSHSSGNTPSLVMKYKTADAVPESNPSPIPDSSFRQAVNTTTGYDYLQVSSVTDPLGRQTSYLYNSFGEITRIDTPDPAIVYGNQYDF